MLLFSCMVEATNLRKVNIRFLSHYFLVSEMTHYVSSGTLNSTNSTVTLLQVYVN